jgi:hypothetical protein
MFKKLITASAGLLLTASVALASPIQTERKDFQVFKDVATSVERYTQFTIFDDVNASVKDGVVTLTGWVTMPYKRDDIGKRRKIDGVREVATRSPICRSRSSTTSCGSGSRGRSMALELRELRDHGQPADSHRRGVRTRDADRRRQQQSRLMGAIAGVAVRAFSVKTERRLTRRFVTPGKQSILTVSSRRAPQPRRSSTRPSLPSRR